MVLPLVTWITQGAEPPAIDKVQEPSTAVVVEPLPTLHLALTDAFAMALPVAAVPFSARGAPAIINSLLPPLPHPERAVTVATSRAPATEADRRARHRKSRMLIEKQAPVQICSISLPECFKTRGHDTKRLNGYCSSCMFAKPLVRQPVPHLQHITDGGDASPCVVQTQRTVRQC